MSLHLWVWFLDKTMTSSILFNTDYSWDSLCNVNADILMNYLAINGGKMNSKRCDKNN